MWQHFKNLLWATCLSALSIGGSTWISFLLLSVGAAVLVSVITLFIEWNRSDRTINSFNATWRQWPTYVVPPVTLIALWIGVFGWSVFRTVYDDHERLIVQISNLKIALNKSSIVIPRAAQRSEGNTPQIEARFHALQLPQNQ
jgi:hypothetical protein